jgi:predicted fused transcriptional regulator/phosphomethylpyrimidine kinase
MVVMVTDLSEKIDMTGRLYLGLEQIESCMEFSALIPQVRTNFVYASKDSINLEDVLAVEGRITVVDKHPKAAGKIKFGASNYMAYLILEIRKADPEIRCVIDFVNSPEIVDFLKDYCKEKGWVFSVIDRHLEPEAVRGQEGASTPWKVAEAIRAAGGKMPKVFCEIGADEKEPVCYLVGKDPMEVAEQICELARKYHESRQKLK